MPDLLSALTRSHNEPAHRLGDHIVELGLSASEFAFLISRLPEPDLMDDGLPAVTARSIGCRGRAPSLARQDLRPSRPQQPPLERTHLALIRRRCVVPAADVERPVGHQQPQLIGRRPSDVARLTATPSLGLLDRPLDRHDDIAEMDPATGWSRDVRYSRPGSECRRWQERERQHVRRAGVPHVRGVEARDLGIVGEDQSDRCRKGCARGVESG